MNLKIKIHTLHDGTSVLMDHHTHQPLPSAFLSDSLNKTKLLFTFKAMFMLLGLMIVIKTSSRLFDNQGNGNFKLSVSRNIFTKFLSNLRNLKSLK